jgi:hypothetical protein
MDFRAATRVSQTLEANNPELVVAGIRQVQRKGKRPTWAVDVVNRLNGKMISLDEKDDWTQQLRQILPDRSTEDARIVNRPKASVN